MQSSRSAPSTLALEDLRSIVSGQVIAPGDDIYEEARAIFPGGIDRHPAVIVRVADASDVSAVVALARDTGMELAVRSGGHSVNAVSDGGIVIDLCDMKGFEIDVEGRTAWAEAGLTAGEFTGLAGEHGLAAPFGDTGSVGIGGITLAGGVGYLVRKHGLTIDNLEAAEIVTADGQLLNIDAAAHPDLFWAIRGGGGNFGVLTRFKFRLHEVGTIVGGMLILPATADVIVSFMEEAAGASEDLSTIANVMPAPPMAFIPEDQHGRLIIMALMACVGDLENGEKTMERFRRLATPIADMVKPMPYPEIYPPEEEGYHPVATGRTLFVDAVDRPMAESILSYLKSSTAMMQVAQLRCSAGPWPGCRSRRPPLPTA